MDANKSQCGQVTFGNGRRYWDEKMLTKLKELQRSRTKLDEEAVRRCYEVLKQWQPISDSCESLVSLSSGIKAF